MPSRRKRFRSWTENALWASAQTLLQLATAVVIVVIFILEDTVIDVANHNQRIQEDQPYAELGMDLNGNSSLAFIENGTYAFGRSPKSDSSARDRVRVYGASLGESSFSEEGNNPSRPKRGTALNLTEFQRLAKEKAVEDAVRKRIASETRKQQNENAVDAKRENEIKNTLDFELADNGSVKAVSKLSNNSQPTSYYQGVQASKENESLFRFENITYLSYMLYRLIKTHEITSVIDIPCTKTIFWLPEVLQRLEFEIPRFHYRCVVPSDEYLVEAILRYKHLSSAVVVKDPTVWASVLPKVDLALAWYAIGYLRPSRSWQLVQTIRQSQTKFVILPNHPLVTNNPNMETKHGRVNVRKQPYLFDQPLRVVKNISSVPAVPKDMLLYEVEAVRQGVI